MSSFSEIPQTAAQRDIEESAENATSYFRRRTLGNRGWFWPRRYVIAFMFFILLITQTLRDLSTTYTLEYIIASEMSKGKHPIVGNWTLAELENLRIFMQVGDIFANIIGALLIYEFSCHKSFLISVTAASILHMLTPIALKHHSVIFLATVLIGQGSLSVPVYTAVLSTWKDWGPPSERTSLVTFSVCGMVIEETSGVMFHFLLFPYLTEGISYYVGIASIVWALFWYNITSDIPQNDPLISENELVYLESHIPSNIQEKIKLKDVPWKSIVKSVQVMILCLIFFKMAFSVGAIQLAAVFFTFHVGDEYNPLYIFLPFLATFTIILLGSAILMDFLIKRYKSYTLKIRKAFLCSGFLLQAILLLGTTTHSKYMEAFSFVLAYSCFALSIPGCFRYPLDLSPRYVSLIAGVGFTFYCLGYLCSEHFMVQTFDWEAPHSIFWLFLFDGVLSLIIAVIFGMWGDVEEQQWSLILSSYHRGSDYKSYPKPEDEDDINLVSGTL